MNPTIEQARLEWNSLVQREETEPYRARTRFTSARTGARDVICDWCYKVVDASDIDRDVVFVALSYFDRYLSSCPTPADEKTTQLAAMTSLYLAVKLHSSQTISLSSMSDLSRGWFRERDLIEMELKLLETLDWHVNPPTPQIYLDIASPIVDQLVEGRDAVANNVRELSRYLLELSVCDEFFADKKPSSVACAAIALAMEGRGYSEEKMRDSKLDETPYTTELCVQRLRRIYQMSLLNAEEDDAPPRTSPTTVRF